MKPFMLLASMLTLSSTAWAGANVAVTTQTYGGEFAQANCTAIWIEDNSHTYVKTIGAWAFAYSEHLTGWMKHFPPPENIQYLSGISSASRTGHGDLNVSWDARDEDSISVSPGTYKIIIEMTEDNGPGYLDTLQIDIADTVRNTYASYRNPFSNFRAASITSDSIPAVPAIIIPQVEKTDSGSMCGGGSIFAMAITFMVTGTHGRIRKRRKQPPKRRIV